MWRSISQFFVSYNKKDGLNIVNYINFQVEEEQKNNELLTVKKAASATQFRGLMEIKDAKVNLLLESKPLDLIKYSSREILNNIQKSNTVCVLKTVKAILSLTSKMIQARRQLWQR